MNKKIILITLLLAACGGGGGSTNTEVCSNPEFPLYCADSHWCCSAGHPYNCDGMCYPNGCPASTVVEDKCSTKRMVSFDGNLEPTQAVQPEEATK